MFAGRRPQHHESHGVRVNRQALAVRPGLPCGVIGLLHEDGLAGAQFGPQQHGIGIEALQRYGGIRAVLHHVDVGAQVLLVVGGTRRPARIEPCGFHDARANGVTARNAVEGVTLAIVVEERRYAGESVGMLDVLVRFFRFWTGHIHHIHAHGL